MPTTVKKNSAWMLVLLLLLSALAATCTPDGQAQPSSGGLEGTISVSGAFALYPMMVRWGEEFHSLHPQVIFDISAGGAGKGMADVLAGAVDIGMVSRPVFDEETQKGAFPVAVAKDAVLCTVNAGNPEIEQLVMRGVTPASASSIWITAEVTTWGALLGTESDDEIHVYTRADACGAAQMWASYMGGYSQEDLQGIAVQADPGLAEAVRQDPLGIGYNNLNFAYDPDTGLPVAGLAVIPLDLNENGLIDPDESFYDTKSDVMRAIAEGSYPCPPCRALYLVTKGRPEGLAQRLIEWVLTDGQQYLGEVGYVALSREQLDGERSKVQ